MWTISRLGMLIEDHRAKYNTLMVPYALCMLHSARPYKDLNELTKLSMIEQCHLSTSGKLMNATPNSKQF